MLKNPQEVQCLPEAWSHSVPAAHACGVVQLVTLGEGQAAGGLEMSLMPTDSCVKLQN